MFSINNDDLEGKPEVGKTVKCKQCGKWHGVRYGDEVLEDGTKVPSKLLAFYKCGDESYLCGIDGKEI